MGTSVVPSAVARTKAGFWWALLAFSIMVYATGLGGQYIPTNGDELVYAHIARVTASTGHWLPLASELDNMRNTKPPLLFWQAIVAGNWGVNWQMATLRLPSLIYTLLITAGVAFAVKRITRDTPRALLAACLYLAFFSTFRYGRPYLTSAPETFWLALPIFGLLWHVSSKSIERNDSADQSNQAQNASIFVAISWPAVLGVGVVWGIGSAYKSFALVAPTAAAFWLALVLVRNDWRWPSLFYISMRVAASAAIALGFFALWFLIDPDPQAVWKEFIVGENIGKMGDRVGYWHEALYGGGSSLWAQMLSYVENAGLLAFVALGFAPVVFQAARANCAQGLRTKAVLQKLPPHLWLLLAWLAVWWLVFIIPSQRSARYVIPAMPALAILLALYWDRIARGWFVASGVVIAVCALAFARVAWVAHDLAIAPGFNLCLVISMVLVLLGTVVWGWMRPAASRTAALVACLLFYSVVGLTTLPLDGPAGRYSARIQTQLKGQKIAVPSNFNAQWERFEFLLPGNRIVPFDMALIYKKASAPAELESLLATHDTVVWGQADPSQTSAPCLPRCQVLAERWVIKERHQTGDVTWANVWQPHTWLFSREWLLRADSGGGG